MSFDVLLILNIVFLPLGFFIGQKVGRQHERKRCIEITELHMNEEGGRVRVHPEWDECACSILRDRMEYIKRNS